MKWLLALAVLAVAAIGIWFSLNGDKQTVKTVEKTPAGEVNEIEVTKTDITQNGTTNLPVGFPSDIPVEANNLTESFRAAYQSRGIVQYSVSYTSLKTRDSLWDAYSSYMNGAGYAVDKTGTSKSLGQISGTKNGDSLSVVLSNHGGLTLVQINYVER
jgi:hypothetical protein